MTDTQIHHGTVESTDLEQMLNPFEVDDGSNKDRKSHYVSPADNKELIEKYGTIDPDEFLNTARFHKDEVVALCGYTWIPKLNPIAFPVCPACARIAGDLIIGEM